MNYCECRERQANQSFLSSTAANSTSIAQDSPDSNKMPKKSSLSSPDSGGPKKRVSFAQGTKEPAPDNLSLSSFQSQLQSIPSGQSVTSEATEMITRF